jgi:toxin ParE1/3/4
MSAETTWSVAWTYSSWITFRTAMDRIAEDRPQSALEQDEAILASVARLTGYPRIGRTGRRKGTRELVVPGTPFIVVYRILEREGRVQIVRFLHGAQKWPDVSLPAQQ